MGRPSPIAAASAACSSTLPANVRQLLFVELPGEQQTADVRRQFAVAGDVERRQRKPHRLQHVDVFEGERLQGRAPGHGETQAVGGRQRRQQQRGAAGQKAPPRGRRQEVVAVKIGARLGAQAPLTALDRARTDLAKRARGRRVVPRELLAQLRRDPAKDGQTDVAPQDLPELRRGAVLVTADDDRSGDLEALGEGADTIGRRSHRGPPIARVQDQHERRVETGGDVDRPRALDTVPAVEGRLHRHQEHEIAALAPAVVELVHGGGVERRVEHPGRPALTGVQEPPQRKVRTDGDRADGVLLGETCLKRAGGKRHGGAWLEPAHHEPGHRHERVLLSAGREVRTAGGRRAKRTSGPKVEYLTRLAHSAEE